ncbi:AprA-related methyltransferase [Paenibacillus kobensis]|uniref:AprA-related methyltransferase n=1 Tax=Paenibacillus kobensis TaxID=59841 RepID=UPI000FDBB681|nr:beta-ketoacyl synthase N-terminal-like domain-containing protein [Paenibacillus kobensis]
MLTILNDYSNGYVAVPVIAACSKQGLFSALSKAEPVSFHELAEKLGANQGFLRIALHMLESMNWIERCEGDAYIRKPQSDAHERIAAEAESLLSFPMKQYLRRNQSKLTLGQWITLSQRQWDLQDPVMARFMDGMLAMPLLLALKENGQLNSEADASKLQLSNIGARAREEIRQFFAQQGWLMQAADGDRLTDTGRFMADRIFITATVASYRPMLMSMDEILFGDCKPIFGRDEAGHELHVDRLLNVVGSGFQHEKYFSDMEEIVLSIFNREPLAEQPRYIADMGCGDGSLLKKMVDIIRDKSVRGRYLQEHPLKLIGIDFNEKALEATSRTLQDTDYLVLKGNIGDPQQVIQDLKELGIDDPEQILHVRSFLDHDRPYLPPADTVSAEERSSVRYDEPYVDSEGNEIPAVNVIQSLVEHLDRWSSVMGKHGMIILEVHCLEPQTVRAYMSKCESLHFDAYHGFSQQLLVGAERFLMAASETGLFPNSGFFRKYPKTMPFGRITLNLFERRDYSIRYARRDDMPALIELEEACWDPGLRTSPSAILHRWEQDPAGQLVLESEGRIVGAVYSQRIGAAEHLRRASFDRLEELYKKDGPVIQLLGLNILPEMQHRNMGDQLLEFMLLRSSLISGVHTVAGITRCKNYSPQYGVSLKDYIRLRNEHGSPVDMNLRFHEWHGADIKELIPGYRPLDTMNEGHGVWIEYDLQQRRQKQKQMPQTAQTLHDEKALPVPSVQKSSTGRNGAFGQGEIRDYVSKVIRLVLGNGDAYSIDRPLMEMGLDSADLLELNERISHEYSIVLEPAFFFQYNTPQLIINFLEERAAGQERQVEEEVAVTNADFADQADELNSRQDVSEDGEVSQGNGIAIVAAACRLPGGVASLDQLWDLLNEGTNAVGRMPAGRWEWPDHIDPEHTHQGIDRGGYLEDISGFDPSFFRISPKEAELIDPQQRLLLELTWECFENAGYPARKMAGSGTGVFIGASGSDYQKLLDKHGAYYGPGASMAALPNRISYYFNLHGPSLQIDTACSSSLVAIHEAVRSLNDGECEQALVGGIHLMCHPANSITYYQAGMLSKDGACRTFDAEANGYVRGEGAAMVLLKPLNQALRDKDAILAVIKGSSVNHGGQAGGLTVPNPAKQADLVAAAFRKAGFAPESVGYIETHGTGTSLGDPVEIGGLKEAFAKLSRPEADAPSEPYCGLGSIKTNIGHLEAAAGIAGLLKLVVSMRNRTIPASLHFNELNPHCSLMASPFFVASEQQSWPLPEGRQLRRGGVSSFGSGGTNAHVLVEEAPERTMQSPPDSSHYLLCLSAKSENALEKRMRDLLHWLDKSGRPYRMAEVCAALLTGREHFAGARAAFVVQSHEDMAEKLKELLEKRESSERCLVFRSNGTDRTFRRQPLFEEMGQNILREIGSYRGADAENRLTALAELYAMGYDLDWNAMYAGAGIPRVPIPTYPFIRERYWVNESRGSQTRKLEGVRQDADDLRPSIAQGAEPAAVPADSGKPMQEPQLAPPTVVRQPEPAESARQGTVQLRPMSEFGIKNRVQEDADRSIPYVALKPSSSSQPASPRVEQSDTGQPTLLEQKVVGAGTGTEMIQEELAQSLADALYMKRGDIDLDEKFVDLGLDSIIGVEWIQNVNKRYGVKIPATRVYNYPTLREFSDYFMQELESSVLEEGLALPQPPQQQAEEETSLVQLQPSQLSVESVGLLEQLANQLAEALYMKSEEIDPSRKFVELGLDSVIGVEWIQAVNRQFGTAIAATQIYAYPTLRDFAEYVRETLEQRDEPAEAARSDLSVDDILEKVYTGAMDSGQALQQLHYAETPK